MSQFYKFITEEIQNDLQNLLSDESTPLRVLWSGLPREMLDVVFELLCGGEERLIVSNSSFSKEIPVLLVDPAVTKDPQNLYSGRCTHNHLVKVRNSEEGSYLGMHPTDSIPILSSQTTVIRKGILEFNHPSITQWMDEPFVAKILEFVCLAYDYDVREDVRQAVKAALTESWESDHRNRDKRLVWELLECLFNASCNSKDSFALYQMLGLPKLEKEQVATSIKLPEKIASYFINGFKSGLENLSNELSDEDIKSALESFVGEIKKTCLTPSDFLTSPMANYAKAKDSGSSDWWELLTTEVWERMLEGNTNYILDVICENRKFKPKSHTTVVQNGTSFLISPLKNKVQTLITIKRSNGNGTLVLIETISLFDQEVRWMDDTSYFEHNSFIRYEFSSDSLVKPSFQKVIDLASFKPEIVINCLSATKVTSFSLKKKKKKTKQSKKNTDENYECEIELNGSGSHTLNLYHIKGINLPKIMTFIDAETGSEGQEKNITSSDKEQAVCLIEAEEDCAYVFRLVDQKTNITRNYKINISVNDFIPKGVSSEFRKLVVQSAGEGSVVNVDVPQTMLTNLEEWILNDDDSYYPIILGPDLKNTWTKPIWANSPVVSNMELYIDPRPSFETLKVSMPKAFRAVRNDLRGLLLGYCDDQHKIGTIESIASIPFGALYLNEKYKELIDRYILEYAKWLKTDYLMAIWCDVITIHSEESNNDCLKPVPDAILLSIFNPVRIAWHCNAQALLFNAIQNGMTNHASGVIDPSVFPNCLALPCLNANSKHELKGFSAVRSSSDYWNVLWNTDCISDINNPSFKNIFSDEFGITIEGLAQGFSIQQVKKSLGNVHKLACGKSTLSVSISSDAAGKSSCNAGIEQWCEENLGLDNDEWSSAGGTSIKIYDSRPVDSQPEPADIASLTARSGTNVRWYSTNAQENMYEEKKDLAIVDHLKTLNNTFGINEFYSAIDSTGLFRQNIKFSSTNRLLTESKVGKYPTVPLEEDQSLQNTLLVALDAMEGSCVEHDLFDSLMFKPQIATFSDSLKNTDFCAVSSSTIDASCFDMQEHTSLLWDFEYPKYSSSIEQSSGFYLLARESDNMHQVLKNSLAHFNQGNQLDKTKCSEILQEISKRGMPTLKKLTGGGTSSLGEIGMLVALRMLQTEGQTNANFDGIISSTEGAHTNLVIPVDIFQPRFDSLRDSLGVETFERPDLIIISIYMKDSRIQSMRLTPVEVKARSSAMSIHERNQALNQAQTFAKFLETMQEQSKKSPLWGMAWREMLASWLDYGFRVYGEYDDNKKAGSNWLKLHQDVMVSILSPNIEVEIDKIGRLISVEKNTSTQVISSSGGRFKDTVVLSGESAVSLLNENQEKEIGKIRDAIANWGFLSADNIPDKVVVTPSNQSGKSSVSGELDTDDSHTPDKVDIETSSGIHFKIGHSLDKLENKDINFYPGNTALNNINIGVVGDLGTGKTQFLKALVYQFVNQSENNRGISPKMLILDYKRDFTNVDDEDCLNFISKANVKVIKPKHLPLNMFQTLDPADSTVWLDRYSFFRDMLNKIVSSQKPIQDYNLKEAIKECFTKLLDRDPTINDVFNAYFAIIDEKVDTTSSIMADIIDYEIFESDPEKIISFEEFFDGTIALDLSKINDDKIKNMIIVIFLNFYYDYMKKVKKRKFLGENPQTRFIDSYLLVDEAHHIMEYGFPVLSKLLLEGREFGVGVILGSQYFSHFKTSKENYMEPIHSWFVHKVPIVSTSDLDRMGLPSAVKTTVDRIASLENFESFCKTLDHKGEFIAGIPFYKLD